jgi:signal transduction histidine kinase
MVSEPSGRPFRTGLALTRKQLLALALAFCALAAIVCFQFYSYQTTSIAFIRIERAVTVIRKTEHLAESFLTARQKAAAFARMNSSESLKSARTAYDTLLAALHEFRDAVKALMLDPVVARQIDSKAVTGVGRIESLIKETVNSGTQPNPLPSNWFDSLPDEIRTSAHALERRYLTYAIERKERLQGQRTFGLAVTAIGTTLAGMVLLLATIELKRAFVQQSELVDQISDSERQYQLLADRLQIVREEERANLAREIHDVLGQALTGIKLDISSAGRRLERWETASALQKLKESSTAVDESIRLLRRIGSELRPPLLDQIGLASAIESYAGEFSRAHRNSNHSSPDSRPCSTHLRSTHRSLPHLSREFDECRASFRSRRSDHLP